MQRNVARVLLKLTKQNDTIYYNMEVEIEDRRKDISVIPKRFSFSLPLDAYPAFFYGVGFDEFFLKPEFAIELYKRICRHFKIERNFGYFIPNVICKDFGGELEISRYKWPMDVNRPVRTMEDLKRLRIPVPVQTFSYPYQMRFLECLVREGKVPGLYISSLFERAAHIAGTANLLKWTRKKPEAVHELMRIMLNYTLEEVEAYHQRFKAKDFWVASAYSFESQNLMSPQMFFEFCAPYIFELHQELYKKGIHNFSETLCGNHDQTLRFWCEDLRLPKGTVVTIDHQMDIEKADEILGEEYVLEGNISHDLLCFGMEAEVYGETSALIQRFGQRRGGFIVAPDCGLSGYTREKNIFAFLQAAEDACLER